MGPQNSCCMGNCTEAPQRVHGTQPPSVQRRKIPDFALDSFSFPPPAYHHRKPLPLGITKSCLCPQPLEVPFEWDQMAHSHRRTELSWNSLCPQLMPALLPSHDCYLLPVPPWSRSKVAAGWFYCSLLHLIKISQIKQHLPKMQGQ